ncbi:MAG: Crp/Fnr family transcriptional regulator [Rhodoferax sp.]
MLDIQSLLTERPVEKVPAGSVLLRRAQSSSDVLFLEMGQVVLGVLGEGPNGPVIEHQLGTVQGPAWIEVNGAILGVPCSVDAVAQTPVQLRRVTVPEFLHHLLACPADVRDLLRDMARAHHQQTDLAVSRLAKDAEARCAEWLLSHAEASDKGGCRVHLQTRKRAIAAQLGIAPETLSRVLRHLRERSLISGSGRVLNLVDPVGLRTLAGPSNPCQCGIA